MALKKNKEAKGNKMTNGENMEIWKPPISW
jgi:hypothetical protein